MNSHAFSEFPSVNVKKSFLHFRYLTEFRFLCRIKFLRLFLVQLNSLHFFNFLNSSVTMVCMKNSFVLSEMFQLPTQEFFSFKMLLCGSRAPKEEFVFTFGEVHQC